MSDDQRVYAERLRLVLDGIAHSLLVGTVLATLLVVVFYFSNGEVQVAISAESSREVDVREATIDSLGLGIWYLAFMVGRGLLVWYTRRTLRLGFEHADMPRIVRFLLVGKIYEGVAWGVFCWLVLQESTPAAATALLLALMAAISSNAVSLLSPIIRLYLGLMLPMLLLAAIRFLVMDGLLYQAMGICCLLYVVGQYGQARIIGRGLSNSIKLRFENLDLIARLETEKALASAAREEAERANQAKSRFLAAASHDLRQPIHALGLFLEALSYSRLDDVQRQGLENARAAGVASADMLNTLLDFSRIEAGVVRPKPMPFALQSLFYKLEQELAPQADAKALIYRSRETRHVVISDPTLLELVLRNLISNAIRYTEQGGILVACRCRGRQVVIEIFDTGIGIAPEQRREVFREFHQLGNPERDRRKGLGLGLAIAEGLARSMGHRLSLVSRLGRGSVFRVEVPLAQDALPAGGLENPPLQALRDTSLEGKRVLVVDDDESVRLAMRHLLSNWGCDCRAVESLDEVFSLDWRLPPQAVICDYRLRERQTGAEVIGMLRAHYGNDIPALLVTGDTAPERLREAEASGIPLLHKPLAAEQLRQALLELLGAY
ncbi:hybrid sensor histidine kinase/response regulator [Stutzerimonas kirkiae]|uniref:histidine kinase n=1 Tax=Stutzerimonas kirkiae TaxID=2211392 RepID=A0A4V2KCQ7_9GAMM|nr:hybrid sensor histidine kinase/response regulator [Stutzerimonas kirkiae]TBU95984.1 hybrid sensor histidine kinase/response regulator [Stutzerimonas kirkiae]TBV03185.1 hybrid sensor histidine kinase/response regulator [Stutzerimonas kirkiae]